MFMWLASNILATRWNYISIKFNVLKQSFIIEGILIYDFGPVSLRSSVEKKLAIKLHGSPYFPNRAGLTFTLLTSLVH